MNLSFKLFPSSILAGFLLFFLAPFVQAEMPVVVHNEVMPVNSGAYSVHLKSDYLKYSNASGSINPEDVIYTVKAIPWTSLIYSDIDGYLDVDDEFTQSDIDNGFIFFIVDDFNLDDGEFHEDQLIVDVRFDGDTDTIENEMMVFNVHANNYDPQITVGASKLPIYRKGMNPVIIFDDGITLSDDDVADKNRDNAICDIEIDIVDIQDGADELLTVLLDLEVSPYIHVYANPSMGYYTLEGCHSLAFYENILKNLAYQNVDDAIDELPDRKIDLWIDDGDHGSDSLGNIIKLDDQNYTGSVDITNSKLLAGDDIKLKVNDMDMNRYANLKETVTVEVKNSTTGEEENVTLTETGVNTGVFEADLDTKLKSSCSTSEDNDDTGKLCVTKSDQITAKYIDVVDQSGNTNKSRTDNITVSSTSSTGGGGGSNDDDDDDDNGSVKGEDSQTVCKREYGFPDICNTKFKTYIKNLKSKNVVNGNSAGYFEPGREITRAEFAAIIRKAFGYELNTGGEYCFEDVARDNKFWADIQTLCKNGVVVGFGDGTEYRPGTNITRGQAVQIIARAMEKKGMNITTDKKHTFQDIDDKNKFLKAINFMSTTKQDGEYIVAGFENGKYFKNDNQITRGESAKIIEVSMRYYESKK